MTAGQRRVGLKAFQQSLLRREAWHGRAPGFMTLTVLAASIVVTVFGWVVQAQYDPAAGHVARTEAVDEAQRETLMRRGFVVPRPGRVVQAAAALRHRVGVEVLVPREPFALGGSAERLSGRPASELEVSRVIGVLTDELARYPQGFLQKSRLRRAIVCERLQLGETRIPSLPNYEQSLLIDAGSTDTFLRRLIHHEVFHFVDYADDDQVLRDPEWERLNDHYFVYGAGGRFEREPSGSALSETVPGFLTGYSTAALEEDKAELFSLSVTLPQVVRYRASKDVIVASKVQALARQLSRFDRRGAEMLRAALGS
jgi:hypothetical protein